MTDILTTANRAAQKPASMIRPALSLLTALSDFFVDAVLLPSRTFSPATKANMDKSGTGRIKRRMIAIIPRSSNMPTFATGATTRAGNDRRSSRTPAEAQYLTRRHRSAAGSRGYRLYLPAGHPEKPKGLILMLHGCNQTPDDFAIGTHMNALAEKHGLAVAYPAQTRRQNRGRCWNWFKPRNQMRGNGEPAILAALTRKLMREFGLGRDDVFVAGLSAGGAMAVILADLYPDIFAAAGVHSGLARGAAWDTLSAMSAMQNGSAPNGVLASAPKRVGPVRRIIFQGADDRTVNPLNAGHIVVAEMGADAAPTRVGRRSVRGRDYARSFYADAKGGVLIELWMIKGSGHAWSGGRAAGSYTDTKGPDASVQMVRFFLDKRA